MLEDSARSKQKRLKRKFEDQNGEILDKRCVYVLTRTILNIINIERNQLHSILNVINCRGKFLEITEGA